MKWTANQTRTIATSECGRYEIRLSTDQIRGDFYNAWFLPANKHVGASHHKRDVLDAVESHVLRLISEATA